MKKYFLVLATLVAALGLIGQTPAEAAKKKTTVVVTPAPAPWVAPWGWWWSGQRDPAVANAQTVVGGASLGAYFAIKDGGNSVFNNSGAAWGVTTFGCAVVSPIVATAWANRNLTRREVWVMSANCVVPELGGWWVNAVLDANPNPLWDQ